MILQKIKEGALVGVGIVWVCALSIAAYAAIDTATSGWTLTATMWNNMKSDVDANTSKLANISINGSNVWIGTSNTLYKLNVDGIVWIDRLMDFWHSSDATKSWQIWEIGWVDPDHFSFAAEVNSSGTAVMTLLRTWNVGIGTTSPTTKLDVAGTFSAVQPYLYGSPTNTWWSGVANSFHVAHSRGWLTWSSDRVNITVPWVYLLTLNTISDSTSWRIDAWISVNGTVIVNLLNEDNGSGYHQKSWSISMYLNSGDYVQFYNNDWYDSTNTWFRNWRTASIAKLH